MTKPTQYEVELLARARASVANNRVCYIVHGEEKVAYPEDSNLVIDLIGHIESLRYALDATHPVPKSRCDKCDCFTINPENDHGEFICDNCEQNAKEAAYERHCEAYHDGGSTQFRSLRDQQIAAMKLK